MSETSSRVRLMANLQAAVAEAVSGTMEERGRGFASDREAWAELKECIERTKQMHTDIEKVHKEMWSAVKDRNEDAFAALSQEFERSSRILAEEWGANVRPRKNRRYQRGGLNVNCHGCKWLDRYKKDGNGYCCMVERSKTQREKVRRPDMERCELYKPGDFNTRYRTEVNE